MARKRNCENKSYLNAIGYTLRFKGVVNKPRYEDLKKCLRWYLAMKEVKNDLVLYFADADDYVSLMSYLRERCKVRTECGVVVDAWDYFTWRLDNDNILVEDGVELAKHLQEVEFGGKKMSFEDYYNLTLESTTRDEYGRNHTSRTSTIKGDYDETPADVKTFSINEYRTNGHF